MTRILHLIDRNTPADMLAQLAVLAGPDDEIISIGRPPELPGPHRVRAIHEIRAVPLSSSQQKTK